MPDDPLQSIDDLRARLLAGTVILTGTPAGVGIGMNPMVFLKPGDVVRCEIDGIGALENPVIDEPPALAYDYKK